jgi:8-oxo-dGTP pyrophosphatase MutT (NUDIX family)
MDRERIVGASPHWRQLRHIFHRMNIPVSGKIEPLEHISHGIMIICQEHGLFIRMSHTYEYKCILRGSYNGVKLYHYLSLITLRERTLLLQHPFIQWNSVFPGTKMPGEMYRKMVLLQKHITTLLEYIPPIYTDDDSYLLDIPKGKSEDSESSIETAIRELHEETGIEVSISDIRYRLKDSYIGTDGNIYTTYIYAIFMDSRPTVSLGTEFQGHMWISINDNILMRRQLKILQTFVSIGNDRHKCIFKCDNSGWIQ